jgi:translation elongation factor EF-4
MVKMDMLIAGDPVEAFSTIVHRDKAVYRGRELAAKLKEVIPTQMFVVAIQAADRRKHHRERNYLSDAQKRDCQVLRWRYLS